MKRVMSLILVGCMLLSCVTVMAADESNVFESFIIEETEDSVIIKGCVDKSVKEIHVPAYIHWKKVELAKGAFKGYEALESIGFSSGIEVLPDELCKDAINLKDVSTGWVETIGRSAFEGCRALTEIDLRYVEVLEDYAFYGCESLEKVTNSGELKRIGEWCFAGAALKEFDFEGVEFLGKNSFFSTGIENIYLTDLTDWDGIATDDVNEETNRHNYPLTARYPLHTDASTLMNAVATPFVGSSSIKTVRIRYPKDGEGYYKSLFMDCDGIEAVIFENFPAEISAWEFYNTKQVVELDETDIGSPEKPGFWEHRYLEMVKPEFKFTIYGRDERVKEYAESLGVPFKELIDVTVNGKLIDADDCLPYIKNSRTMVPLRAIFEALGAAVTWDDETKTAIGVKGDTEVKIAIGENVLYKNGEAIMLDAAAEIANGRTMVPVRAVSEALESRVEWHNDTRTVEIIAEDALLKTWFTYDEEGRLIRRDLGERGWEEKHYDEKGNMVKADSHLGSAEYKYDEENREIYRTDSSGFEVETTYDEKGNKVKVITRNKLYGHYDATEEYTYNEKGQRVTYKRNSTVETYTYDENGNRIRIDDSYGGWVKYTYDERNNMTYKEKSDGGWEKNTYDEKGNLICWETSYGKKETYAYDETGKLIREENEEGIVTTYAYDEAGNKILMQKSNGIYEKWEYDEKGRVVYNEYYDAGVYD